MDMFDLCHFYMHGAQKMLWLPGKSFVVGFFSPSYTIMQHTSLDILKCRVEAIVHQGDLLES